MIHTARQSPKFKRFIRRLRPMAANEVVDTESIAVAILERLWHQTAIGAKPGDIGRFDNELIAEECGWLGDPNDLISALVDCGFLDESDEHRLVVHDWHDHAPNYVKGVIAKSEASGKGGWASQMKIPSPEPGSATESSEPPNETKQNETKPNPSSRSEPSVECEIPELLSTPEFLDCWKDYRNWILTRSGAQPNTIQLKHQLIDLVERGHDKAIEDLKLTMRSAKHVGTIWDSSRSNPSIAAGKQRSPEEMYGETKL